MKIVFAASSGGHFEQLMMLKPLMEKYDSFILTEKTDYQVGKLDTEVYYLKQINRKEPLFLLKAIANTVISLRIFFKESPDVMITTGVLAIVPFALIMKLFGRKLIYIESFAKVTTKTMSGTLLYRFADQFYVQWEEMLQLYPNAIFKGGIY